jgi:hypothetical protein
MKLKQHFSSESLDALQFRMNKIYSSLATYMHLGDPTEWEDRDEMQQARGRGE